MLSSLLTLLKRKSGYFFIHIPKTAGTSFINILDTTTHNDKIFPCQLWHEINQDIIDEKQNYEVTRGHFGGGSYKLLTNRNPHLLTILRHPQSLSISTYHFIKREKNTAVHQLVIDKKMGLKEFLEEPLTALKINNRMVRHLSFDLQQDPEAQELFLSPQSISVVKNWIKTPKKISNSKRLARAIRTLEKCSWFGIQEFFDESMQLFSYTFKLPPINKSPFLNAHKPEQNLNSHCASLIDSQNEYDIKLYNYAIKKFKKCYENMQADLNQYGEELSLNEQIDLHYQTKHPNKLNKKINYDFSMNLLGSSWHRREVTHPEESYFRWTSNNNNFIDFWLTPKEYKLSIRIINSISLTNLDNLIMKINGFNCDYVYDTTNGVVRILSSNISSKHFKNNLLRIQLIHQKTSKHSDVFESNDNRDLGIAVNWITLIPCQTNKNTQ